MTQPDKESWKDQYNGRERVRMVVETLGEPATVAEVADRADVAQGTADTELDALLAKGAVRETTADGSPKYEPNPDSMLVDELLDMAAENTREELESALVSHQSQLESLREEYDVDTLSELRDSLDQDDLSAEEVRDVRNAVSTWNTLDTEIRLTKRALEL